jgi:hypothetical protein
MNRADILQYFEDYNTGDYEKTMKKYYTSDAVFESADYKLEGRDEIIKFMIESHRGSTETMKAKHVLVDDNVAAVEIEALVQVFEDKPNFHVKPLKKGDSITLKMIAIYEIKDNKIDYVRLYRFTKWSSV